LPIPCLLEEFEKGVHSTADYPVSDAGFALTVHAKDGNRVIGCRDLRLLLLDLLECSERVEPSASLQLEPDPWGPQYVTPLAPSASGFSVREQLADVLSEHLLCAVSTVLA
jgi:hypothetical protein